MLTESSTDWIMGIGRKNKEVYFALSRNQTNAQGKACFTGTVGKDLAAYNCVLSSPHRPLVWIDDEVNM